ncbi:alpha/beta hydrolase [Okibacterium endophyticum]
MIRTRSTLAAAAIAAVVALGLSGCFTAFVPGGNGATPSATPSPTVEDVAENLKPFYGQELEWTDCDGGFECTAVTAPMDWENPEAGEIELAVIRQAARGDDRIGSLLTNPGGPGASGYEFVAGSLDFAVDSALQERFDIVGFDPRGVGRSTAVECLEPDEMDEYLYGIVEPERGSEEWIAEMTEGAIDFGAACLENTGEPLGFIDTVSSARDMDLLRAVLGDAKLNYLGYSYGTFLGATYAELYPEKVGRMVLDGAIDPAASNFDVTKTQAIGFENALEAYLDDCVSGQECPFDGTVDEAMQVVADLLASVDETPIRNEDGRMLGSSTLLTAIIYPLYSAGSWSALSDMFREVMAGDAQYAFYFADAYNGRDEDGTYADNSTEAFSAYNCLDYTYDDDPAKMAEEAEQLAEEAPVIGRYMSYGDISCASWPFTDGAERDEIHAEGAAPILVIGTTNDPATPYVWAESLAEQLDSGVLVTYEGEGHTAYNKGSTCVNDTVDEYLIEGTVPSSDPECD